MQDVHVVHPSGRMESDLRSARPDRVFSLRASKREVYHLRRTDDGSGSCRTGLWMRPLAASEFSSITERAGETPVTDRKPFVGPRFLRCRPGWKPGTKPNPARLAHLQSSCEHFFVREPRMFGTVLVCTKCGLLKIEHVAGIVGVSLKPDTHPETKPEAPDATFWTR